MKRVLFAIQVFSLIALFPTYLVMELSRETKQAFVEQSTPAVHSQPENTDEGLAFLFSASFTVKAG